ncbi:GNAT family N-acetyltransferase [Arenibaculum pallidiluteum]|uniref:GNAT family N-acetyltransferase n=1 Tax=Arenibaculum pallidiluteum TaxID=2812559 RepID=UPI001A9565EC|nr:GNAT family N-acetyltransferase [Arenibaculum pallidiluteum]
MSAGHASLEALAPTRINMSALRFRSAQPDDLPSLRRLYLQLVPDESPSIEDMRSALARMDARPEAGLVVVGELGGRVIATCQLVIYENLVRTPRIKAQIDSVVVDADFRGQGVGRSMMEWALDLLSARGCAKVIVATSYARNVAHELYRHLGFEEFGYSFVRSRP